MVVGDLSAVLCVFVRIFLWFYVNLVSRHMLNFVDLSPLKIIVIRKVFGCLVYEFKGLKNDL